MPINKWVIVILCVFYHKNSFSQSLSYTNIETKSGIPSSEVYSILQDSKFRIWVCTDNGIFMQHGESYKTYSTIDGLPTNTIFKAFENKLDGKVWFICYGFGLYYYDEGIQKFKCPNYNSKLIEILKLGFINDCAFDSIGNLWITSKFKELLCITEKGKIIRKPDRLGKNSGFEILDLGQNMIMRNIYSPNSQITQSPRFKYVETNYNKYIVAPINWNISFPNYIKTDNDGMLVSYLNKVLCFDKSRKYKQLNFESNVLAMVQDDKKNFWIGTLRNGIVCVDSTFTHIYKPLSGLSNLSVTSIIQDVYGKIWFSTLTNGIYCISNNGVYCYLSGEKIQKIYKTRNKLTLVASNGRLLYGETNFNFKLVSEGNEIKEIYEFANQVFICKAIYNKEIPKFLDIKNIAANSLCLTRKFIVLGNKTNLIFYSLNLKHFKNYIAPSPIFKVLALSDETLLLGCLNGVYLFKNNKFEIVIGEQWPLNSRVNDIITRHGRIFVLTDGNGLYEFVNNSLKKIFSINGRNFSSIRCLVSANDSTFWFGTSRGLFKGILNHNLQIRFTLHLTTSTGLTSNTINNLLLLGDTLIAATNSGICVLNSRIRQNPIIAPIFFKSIIANYSDTIYNHCEREVKLFVQKKWRNILINFTQNSWLNHEILGQISYRLMHNGSITTPWTPISDNSVQFTNLSHGKYRFEIKIEDDITGEHYTSTADFEIEAYYYEKTWVKVVFWCLMGLLAITAVWLIIRKVRYDHELKRKMMNAEISSLRNQMNPHFIFNALNSIQYLIFENNHEQASKFLSKFAKLIRKSLEFSKLNFISIKAELQFVEEYLEIEKLRFKDKFDYKIEVDSQIDPESDFIPPLMMQPLIENAIKHGFHNKSDKGQIWLKLEIEEPGILKYSVTDNGSGFKKGGQESEEFKTSLSLNILKERFTLLKADFSENESIGMSINNLIFENKFGTEIILKIPLSHD